MKHDSTHLLSWRTNFKLHNLALAAIIPLAVACKPATPEVGTEKVPEVVTVCTDGYTAVEDLCTTSLVLVEDGQTQMGEFVGMLEFETVSSTEDGAFLALTSAATVRAGRGDTDGIRLRLDPALFPQGTVNYTLSLDVTAPDATVGLESATGYQVAVSVPPMTSSGWMDRPLEGVSVQTDVFEGELKIGADEPIPFVSIWPNTDGTPRTILLKSATLTLTLSP